MIEDLCLMTITGCVFLTLAYIFDRLCDLLGFDDNQADFAFFMLLASIGIALLLPALSIICLVYLLIETIKCILFTSEEVYCQSS